MPPTSALARTAPAGAAIVRAYDAKIDDVLPGERSVVARINTSHVDRYRTVIDPMGGDTSNYNRNGPVLWNHGKDPLRGTLPIGKGWVKRRSSEGDLIGKTKFHTDEFSQQIFEMYQNETLRGWSVNILPSEASPPTQQEIRARPELADCEMIYRKWELAEFSAVAIPGNADALTLVVSRGLLIPDDAREVYEAIAARAPAGVTQWTASPDPVPVEDELSRAIEQFKGHKGQTFADVHLELVSQIRAWRDETKAEYEALRDLMVYGRV